MHLEQVSLSTDYVAILHQHGCLQSVVGKAGALKYAVLQAASVHPEAQEMDRLAYADQQSHALGSDDCPSACFSAL